MSASSKNDTNETAYDVVPYQSWPFAQSHPDRLAVMAKLFGLDPTRIDRSRVLELGCAAGGNLLPLAQTYSASQFVGIDLSARELCDGQQTLGQLSLSNIELRQANILDVDASFGTFDYIIAHGVFSWIPTEVQEHVFRLCKALLRPHGVAYISFNTYPGWHMRGMIRSMLTYHTRQFSEPREQIEQARGLLKFLSHSVPTEGNPYGAYLQQELEWCEQSDDSYLYHDLLAGINEPTLFHEFVDRAESHGLQYLSECDLASMASCNFNKDVDETLQRLSQDLIQIEQYMDFLRNRTFRQTLLCHREHALDRTLNPKYCRTLHFASPLAPESSSVDLAEGVVERFAASGIAVNSSNPMIKAAHVLMSRAWPVWIPFDQLTHEAMRLASIDPTDEPQRQRRSMQLGEHLIRCFASRAVVVHSAPPTFETVLNDRPAVTDLTRYQAKTLGYVTNQKHEVVQLDAFCRCIAERLDGTRTISQLTNEIHEMISNGQLRYTDHGDDSAQSRSQLNELPLDKTSREVQWALDQIRSAFLLVASFRNSSSSSPN
ncbi:methyltransferase regulatory domain-containing protein [Roseiconus lacunae]|uniref:methyltransferase regulatory domain-containing protein n=1 Tax=Roseiconus lacunae TaxID=2605694 RepID=UPI001E36D72E|nr:class I SAM-dependent methyltransferase [Roseiconus lacunae]MCD0460741.1 class I SAM-dependent methyltransferase [Roseiconus lacunae]